MLTYDKKEIAVGCILKWGVSYHKVIGFEGGSNC